MHETGLYVGSSGVTKSILSNNGPNCSPGTQSGPLVSDNSCGAGPLTNTPANIGPLANNGGPTRTHALLPGSAAINAQPNPCDMATDQRGITRPQGVACDFGSFELEIAPPPPPPNAPSNVNAQLASTDTINVIFTDNANDETGLEIERRIGGGAYSVLVSTNSPLPGTQSGWYYPDSGLGGGLMFCYRLRVKRGAEFSAYSNETCATTPASSLPAPSSVTAYPDGQSAINVSFTDNATNETGIEIERKQGVGGIYGVIVSTSSALPGAQSGWYYPDSGLSAGTTYCYRMRVKQGPSYSAYSNESCAATFSGGPPAPTMTGIFGATTNKLDVVFNDNAPADDGIEIERKEGHGGAFALVKTTAPLPGTQSGWYWTNSGLEPNTTYCYRLRARQGATFSTYSNEACGKTTSAALATAARATGGVPSGS